jgi:hypothetical protein
MGQERIITADGRHAIFLSPAVNRHIFAENIAIANTQPGLAAPILEILGLAAEERVGINLVILAQSGMAFDGSVVLDDRPRANGYIPSNVSKGANNYIFCDLRALFDDCCGMSIHGIFTTENMSSAEDTTCPLTRHSPAVMPIFSLRYTFSAICAPPSTIAVGWIFMEFLQRKT